VPEGQKGGGGLVENKSDIEAQELGPVPVGRGAKRNRINQKKRQKKEKRKGTRKTKEHKKLPRFAITERHLASTGSKGKVTCEKISWKRGGGGESWDNRGGWQLNNAWGENAVGWEGHRKGGKCVKGTEDGEGVWKSRAR